MRSLILKRGISVRRMVLYRFLTLVVLWQMLKATLCHLLHHKLYRRLLVSYILRHRARIRTSPDGIEISSVHRGLVIYQIHRSVGGSNIHFSSEPNFHPSAVWSISAFQHFNIIRTKRSRELLKKNPHLTFLTQTRLQIVGAHAPHCIHIIIHWFITIN